MVQAGRPKMVTIATNMAGRGTDIVLGGNPEPDIQNVKDDPELSDSDKEHRIAEMRAEWQKLHDQVVEFRGRPAHHRLRAPRIAPHRQPGCAKPLRASQGDPEQLALFFLSFEDPLLKIFAGERLQAIMRSLKIPEGEAIEAGMVTRSIETAQRKVEARNFDIRKQLLEYDDVANDQRKVIYAQRKRAPRVRRDIVETIQSIRRDVLAATVAELGPDPGFEAWRKQWDLPGLEKKLESEFFIKAPVAPSGPAPTKRWMARRSPSASSEEASRRGEYDAKFAPIEGDKDAPQLRARGDAPVDRHALARAPRRARLPAPGHPLARLRAEAAEAGIQGARPSSFSARCSTRSSARSRATSSRCRCAPRKRSRKPSGKAEEAAHALKNVQYQHADFIASALAEEAPARGHAGGRRRHPRA